MPAGPTPNTIVLCWIALNIPLLPEGFRLYGFAARGDADAVRREGVNFILAAFLHQGENIPHVLLAERFAAVNER